MSIRLNKFLADAGIASRRAADKLIAAGKVAIDGQRAKVGDSVDPAHQRVTLNGKRVYPRAASDHVTLVLNKPLHVITTLRDERGRPTVADFLPKGRRLFPVGRLDADTTGVLLCTTDGALARALLHPSKEVAKNYVVIVRGKLTPEIAANLGARDVTQLADGSTRFSITLKEGKNRQIRRMCARNGLRVLSLTRISFGPIALGKLKPGSTRPLTESEQRELARLRANG